MLDIVFCSVPYSNMDHIYSAPAILKGVVQDNGFSAKTVEFGCTLMELCGKDAEAFHKAQKYFSSNLAADQDQQQIISQFYDRVIQFFKDHPSRYIGLSAISAYSHRAIYEICVRIKQAGIKSNIVSGGRGINIPPWKIFYRAWNIKGIDKTLVFGQYLIKHKLADAMIVGDGEDAIVDLLMGKSQNVVSEPFSDMFRSPVPDYSDYQFDYYLFDKNDIGWPITGSKGCVRNCDFCDIKKHFGKYRYRSGKDVANEMIQVSRQTGTKKFVFTDSLVNGGLKPFREFLLAMSEYNTANPDQRIRWTGQYISRPDTPEDIYPLIHSSGGEGLTIGAESGSNHVLAAMNKKTTVEALFRELELFRKNNITSMLLLMVGHWSEQWEDFVAQCRTIVQIVPYVRSGTVSAISMGEPLSIIHGTPLYENADQHNIVFSDFDPSKIWFCKDNPTNTYRERVYRQILVAKLAEKFRIPNLNKFESYNNSLAALDYKDEEINKFYQQFF